MMTRRSASLGRLALAAALFATSFLAIETALAAEFTPELRAVIDAAKAEGELDLVWGQGTLGGSGGMSDYERGISAMFGTNIQIKFTPGSSMPEMGNDVALRAAAGQPSRTDILVSYADVLSRIHARDLFVPIGWQSLLPGRITDAMVEDKGAAIKIATAFGGIGYNTRLAPHKPESLADLLKPEWKGKIATTPYAANFDVLSGLATWGPDKALDFATRLSDQAAGLMRCNEGERLATGEFIAFAITCSGVDFADLIDKGAPIAQVVPGDFLTQEFLYLSIPRNSAHPNAAKLFVAFIMSHEGQQLLYRLTHTDQDLFPDTNMGKQAAALEKKYNAKLTSIDIQWYLDHPESFATWEKILKIFASKK